MSSFRELYVRTEQRDRELYTVTLSIMEWLGSRNLFRVRRVAVEVLDLTNDCLADIAEVGRRHRATRGG